MNKQKKQNLKQWGKRINKEETNKNTQINK